MKIVLEHTLGFKKAKLVINSQLRNNPLVKEYKLERWIIDNDEIGFTAYGVKKGKLQVTETQVIIEATLAFWARPVASKIERALKAIAIEALGEAGKAYHV